MAILKYIIELENVQSKLTASQALKAVDINKLTLAFQNIDFEGLNINLTKE